ncbi:hypothetical protein B5F29_15345 [Lachnoclostridium sp. An196]|uniref:DVU_1553 family AMP-dependent CoA ligase n=1 Tax=Lachnoclostridium sp. An196 TaxID=1965583 RepID=UPI000B396F34|nr:AMP-binding protein [Lachnoclostridium sp. An196]OUP15998.1 hypothetical protein B5F29_15345 [Lachnoclostridium sp. An196]
MKRTNLDGWIRRQEGVQDLERKQIEEIQLRKLNILLKREKERGGFYRSLPDRLDTLEDLRRLPFTTEKDLIREGHRMVLTSQSGIERVRSQETSGTAGKAKRVYYSAKDNERTVSFFAAGLSELVFPGEKVMVCMPFSGNRGLGELIAEAVGRLKGIPLAAGTGRSYGELLDILDVERPQVFVGMPVPLLSLLRLRPENSLVRALVSADACPDTVRKEIEARLGTRLYPHYGSREIGLGGAVTCPAFEGMHLRENDLIAEIVDEEGRVLPRGEWGELVLTSIEADAMPLIRYRTGDITRILPEPCPCGSAVIRLDRVRRRSRCTAMEKLDDRMFQYEEVVDYRMRMEGDTLYAEGYLRKDRADFPEELEGYPIRYRWKTVAMEDMPCYAGKRKITGMEKR